MTAKQLAGRVGVTQQAIARIEKDELSGSVTIKTMRRVAEGLDCEFDYGFVPRQSLETTVREQARKLATKRLSRASQTMALEDQALGTEENEQVLSEMTDDLVDTLPSNLWNQP
jgi:predicted DNA-binding mobile mystery protein A